MSFCGLFGYQTRMSTRAKNVRFQAAILERLQDLIEDDPTATAMALASSVLPVLATKFGADLTPAGMAAIKANYPAATRALAQERALTPEGVLLVLGAMTVVSKIALDYLPGSLPREQLAADDALEKAATQEAMAQLRLAHQKIQGLGFSSFGAVALPVINSVAQAKDGGTNPFHVYRVLLDALAYLEEGQSPA